MLDTVIMASTGVGVKEVAGFGENEKGAVFETRCPRKTPRHLDRHRTAYMGTWMGYICS
jgi:hypothetical protein